MRYVILGLVLGALASCGEPSAGGATGSDEMTETSDRSDRAVTEMRPEALEKNALEQAPEAAGEGEVPDELLAPVREDLAGRVGADRVPLLRRAEAVVWPSGAMGCPEPGMSYIQVLVPGYHVVFEVDGEPFDYRLNENGRFRLCESPVRGAGAARPISQWMSDEQ